MCQMPFPIGASQRDTLYRYFAVHLLRGQPGYKDRYPKNLKKALYEKQPICEFIRTAKLFEKSLFETEMFRNKGMSTFGSQQTF